jgi:RimJ/RimL family protein N-acetyltransferase
MDILLTDNGVNVKRLTSTDLNEIEPIYDKAIQAHPTYFQPTLKEKVMNIPADSWSIRLNDSDKIVGLIWLGEIVYQNFEERKLEYFPEIYTIMDSNFTRKGYCSIAVKLVVDYLFQNGVVVLYAQVDNHNIASIKMLQKMKFKVIEHKQGSNVYRLEMK